MEAFLWYNQIKMEQSDQEKASFITSQRLFCYKVMPFKLKDVSATYQRLVNKIVKQQIGKNIEVYVDDIIIIFKSIIL